jgi:hypothetical protein
MKRYLLASLAPFAGLAILAACSDSTPGVVPAPSATTTATATATTTATNPADSAPPKEDSAVDPPKTDASADAVVDPPAPATMAELFKKLAPKAVLSTMDAALGGPVTGRSISLVIPPGVIVDKNGAGPFSIDSDGDGVNDANPVSGMVNISFREFNTQGDMLRGDHATMTRDGRVLESGGSFDLSAEAGGKKLTILHLNKIKFTPAKPVAQGAPMNFFIDDASPSGKDNFQWELPVKGPPAPDANCTTKDQCARDRNCADQVSCRPFLCPLPGAATDACALPLCQGIPACTISAACAAPNACVTNPDCIKNGECRIKCRGKCDTDECRRIEPTCAPFPVPAETAPGNPDYLFNGQPFGSIGSHQSANCDRLTYLSNTLVTVQVRFTANYSAQSGVFFLPTVENATVKLYTKIPGAPVGQEGYKSYDNSMPVGIAGKLVVVALKDGKYFYEERPYTIGAGAAGVEEVMVAPGEVSQAIFDAKISAL